jgi:hypothetical protein
VTIEGRKRETEYKRFGRKEGREGRPPSSDRRGVRILFQLLKKVTNRNWERGFRQRDLCFS